MLRRCAFLAALILVSLYDSSMLAPIEGLPS